MMGEVDNAQWEVVHDVGGGCGGVTYEQMRQCFVKEYAGFYTFQQCQPFSPHFKRADIYSVNDRKHWNLIVSKHYCFVIGVSKFLLENHYLLRRSTPIPGWQDVEFASLFSLENIDAELQFFKDSAGQVDMHYLLQKFANAPTSDDLIVIEKMNWSDDKLCEHAQVCGVMELNINGYKQNRITKKQFINLINMKIHTSIETDSDSV